MRKQLTRAAVVLVLMGSVLSASACGKIYGQTTTDSQPCLPPKYTLTPSSAKPGDTVKVEAKDATCNPRYGKNAQIQVTLTDASGVPGKVQLGPMNDAGGFSFDLKVPAGAAEGKGSVEAYPYNLDWCDDTGRNNRVGVGTGEPVMHRASCAQILVPITIAK